MQVWQGGTVLIVVEDPILARQVNTRNYARPRFLLPFAGERRVLRATKCTLNNRHALPRLRGAMSIQC